MAADSHLAQTLAYVLFVYLHAETYYLPKGRLLEPLKPRAEHAMDPYDLILCYGRSIFQAFARLIDRFRNCSLYTADSTFSLSVIFLSYLSRGSATSLYPTATCIEASMKNFSSARLPHCKEYPSLEMHGLVARSYRAVQLDKLFLRSPHRLLSGRLIDMLMPSRSVLKAAEKGLANVAFDSSNTME